MKCNYKYIVFFLLFSVTSLFGQVFSYYQVKNGSRGGRGSIDDKVVSWGYYLGGNSLDYKIFYRNNLHKDIEVETSTGFNVGFLANLKIGEHFDLRTQPGMVFSTRKLKYPISYTDTDMEHDFSKISVSEREIQSSYVYLPLLIKWSAKRIGNFKPFLIGGVATTIDLSSAEKSKDDNFSGKFRTIRRPGFLELGVGIDFYMYYFKVSPTLTGVFGTSNEIVRDKIPNSPWTGNISKLKTRGFFLNIVIQ